MKKLIQGLLTILLVMAGIVGCDSKPKGVRAFHPASGSNVRGTFHAIPQKTGNDVVKDVVDTLAIYKRDLRSSCQRIGQIFNDNNKDDMTKLMALQKVSEDLMSHANKLKQLNVNSCPIDFQAQYRNYVEKWNVFASSFYTVLHPNGSTDPAIWFINVASFMNNGNLYTQDIDAVRKELLTLAKNKYGVSCSVESFFNN